MEGKTLQLYNIFCVDYRSKSVKKYQWSKFFFKTFFPFFMKKVICISVDSIKDSDKLQQNQNL